MKSSSRKLSLWDEIHFKECKSKVHIDQVALEINSLNNNADVGLVRDSNISNMEISKKPLKFEGVPRQNLVCSLDLKQIDGDNRVFVNEPTKTSRLIESVLSNYLVKKDYTFGTDINTSQYKDKLISMLRKKELTEELNSPIQFNGETGTHTISMPLLNDKVTSYSRAVNNLKSFLENNKHSKDVLLASLPSDSVIATYNKCEKSIQTCAHENLKRFVDKCSQTMIIVTRNTYASTEYLTKNELNRKNTFKTNNEKNSKKGKINMRVGSSISTAKYQTLSRLNQLVKSEILRSKPMPSLVLKNRIIQKANTKKTTDYLFHSEIEANVINTNGNLNEENTLSQSESMSIESKLSDCKMMDNNAVKSPAWNEKEDNKKCTFWSKVHELSESEKFKFGKVSIQISSLSSVPSTLKLTEKPHNNIKDEKPNGEIRIKVQNQSDFNLLTDVFHNPIKRTTQVRKSSLSQSETIRKKKPYNYYQYDHKGKLIQTLSNAKFVRVFYFNYSDDFIKSHLRSKDRRIKSVSTKYGFNILIEGPINSGVYHLVNNLIQPKVIYRCTFFGSNQDNFDKCINYLKEIFPNTYFRRGIKNVLK